MKTKLARPSLLGILLLSSTFCSLTGCVRLVVIPADREISWQEAGQVAPRSGYLVPKARMLEILDGLGNREVETRPK